MLFNKIAFFYSYSSNCKDNVGMWIWSHSFRELPKWSSRRRSYILKQDNGLLLQMRSSLYKYLSTRHRRNLTFSALAQVAAMGSVNSLHLTGTKTSMIKI